MENHQSVPLVSETEVMSAPTRRRFTAEYKIKILEAAARCTERGELGALLRREGLYSSHLAAWRTERRDHGNFGLGSRKRGPAPKAANPLAKELAAKDRELAAMRAELTKLQLICEVQKKVSRLLGIVLPNLDDKAGSKPGSPS